MLKKWFPRGVLVLMICGISYLMWHTWGWEFATPNGSRPTSGNLWMLPFFIETGVMIAVASLLVETFLSKDLGYSGNSGLLKLFYGVTMKEDRDENNRLKGDVVYVHICELLMVRSMAIVMFGGSFIGGTIMWGYLMYEFIIFLINPYLPKAETVLPFVWIVLAVCVFGPLVVWLQPVADRVFSRINSIKNLAYRSIVWWAFISTAFSLVMIVADLVARLTGNTSLMERESLYTSMLLIPLFSFMATAIIGSVLAFASGLYWLARQLILRLSFKFSWLNELWDTVCPVVEVRVARTKKTA